MLKKFLEIPGTDLTLFVTTNQTFLDNWKSGIIGKIDKENNIHGNYVEIDFQADAMNENLFVAIKRLYPEYTKRDFINLLEKL